MTYRLPVSDLEMAYTRPMGALQMVYRRPIGDLLATYRVPIAPTDRRPIGNLPGTDCPKEFVAELGVCSQARVVGGCSNAVGRSM